jgi:hypothetical protein
LHWANSDWRQRPIASLEMRHDILNRFAQLRIEPHGIITMNSTYQVWTLTNVDLVFIRPLDPPMILVFNLHLSQSPMLALLLALGTLLRRRPPGHLRSARQDTYMHELAMRLARDN